MKILILLFLGWQLNVPKTLEAKTLLVKSEIVITAPACVGQPACVGRAAPACVGRARACAGETRVRVRIFRGRLFRGRGLFRARFGGC